MKSGNLACSLGRLAVLLALAAVAQAQSARVIEIDIDRVVHPLTAEIVSQGLAQADRDNDVGRSHSPQHTGWTP